MYKDAESVIKAYIEGTECKDITKLESVFSKNAVMYGYLDDTYIAAGPKLFIEDIKNHPPLKEMDCGYLSEIGDIKVVGDIANVELKEYNFFGKSNLITYFHLINNQTEGWTIVSKIFSSL